MSTKNISMADLLKKQEAERQDLAAGVYQAWQNIRQGETQVVSLYNGDRDNVPAPIQEKMDKARTDFFEEWGSEGGLPVLRAEREAQEPENIGQHKRNEDQFERNSSVERQIEANQEYARQHNFKIAEEFGGTYESAKSDFTRKEFKRLIDKVKGSRQKPYAILVYKMSRFSRSGGNAIGLVNMLVEDLGVHLIEVCNGIATTTERGKAAIYDLLFQAYRENLEKKELVVAFMRGFLKKGNWCGPCPTGYDHYGPRVRREKFLSLRQRFEINKEGELLRAAWQWKASGMYSDAQILAKLTARGLQLYPQTISKIWRNPFYCSVLVHKLLDEPVPGNCPSLVTQENFIT